jgi:hypothetical protein
MKPSIRSRTEWNWLGLNSRWTPPTSNSISTWNSYQLLSSLESQKESKFYKFISKRRIISLMHSPILWQIWLKFMTFCLGFFSALLKFSQCFQISNFFSLSITEETLLVKMHIWCIKIGIVLVLHANIIIVMYYTYEKETVYFHFVKDQWTLMVTWDSQWKIEVAKSAPHKDELLSHWLEHCIWHT